MEIIIALLGGALLFLLKNNRKLRSDMKLKDLKEQDSILQKDQESIKIEKEKLKKELSSLDNDSLPNADINPEDYWSKK